MNFNPLYIQAFLGSKSTRMLEEPTKAKNGNMGGKTCMFEVALFKFVSLRVTSQTNTNHRHAIEPVIQTSSKRIAIKINVGRRLHQIMR